MWSNSGHSGLYRIVEAFGRTEDSQCKYVGSLSLQSTPEWTAYDYAKYAVYASSKAAMNIYTVHLAYELRDTDFKINAVCPGYTKTDFTNYNGVEVEEAGKRIINML